MIQLPFGCFWCARKPFDPLLYFQANKFHVTKIESYEKAHQIFLGKLWRRKSLFAGESTALSLETDNYLFFYEEIPGQLFNCDAPSEETSLKVSTPILCFFSYPNNTTCGFKIYEAGKLTRHIEASSGYRLSTNIGSHHQSTDSLINISTSFNHQQLLQYLQLLLTETPPDPNNVLGQPHQFYHFIR